MPFRFLKYVQPTHYFRLPNQSGQTIFPQTNLLPEDVLNQLDRDQRFKTNKARDYDLSWQAIQRGYIGKEPTYTSFERLPVSDNYLFIRKYFNSAWVFYILILRLFSFHNPFKELSGWFSTRSVKRITKNPPIHCADYKTFTSSLIAENPKVSVVIPTLNRYAYLKQILKDFELQDYKNFEVIVVDQSEPFDPDFYSDFNLEINLIYQEEKALWLARNTAVKVAKGKLIALSEDDVEIQPDWIRKHIECLDFFDAKVSAGVFYPKGKQIPHERSFYAIASQFATGNSMLYKDVFKRIGLFDRQFEKQRMGDGEFGMRAYLDGVRCISNPYASCIDVKAGTGGLREMGSWDAFRPSSFLAPKPIPSVIYFYRRYFGNKATRLALLRTIPFSILPYQFKKNRPVLLLGGLISVLLVPLVLYQVMKSWQLASKKIAQGPSIETLS
ncbi:glycosyltransferase [uncultured Psychroserpens sp.]|uniref:glycosyltransferase family 2 protein n=1 Tax=uncultured Psychroserpens sp. TaxID=255436 RepID=UPI002611CE6F|nr:glycosyltransferase [uncultured Psychroserpens sp.]